jgi:hypothetical protein
LTTRTTADLRAYNSCSENIIEANKKADLSIFVG